MEHHPGPRAQRSPGFSVSSPDATSKIDANMTDDIMTSKKRNKGLRSCLIGLSAAIALTAAAAETPFVVALRGKPPETLGPTSYLSNDLAIVSQIMEGLVKFDPMNPTAIPEKNLADNIFEINSLTYIIEIRNDVVFHPFPRHPHDRLTAGDVKFSIDNAKKSDSRFSDRMENISSVEVHGNSVKIKLKRPMKDFLAILATSIGYITSEAYYTSLGKTDEERRKRFGRAPLGTGPFLVRAPLADGSPTIVLDRFEGYRDRKWAKAKGAPSSVTYRFYADSAAILTDLTAGTITMTSLPATEFGVGGSLQGKGSFIQLTPPFLVLLTINASKPLLRDERARQLLNAAVDVREIARMCPTTLKGLPRGYKMYMEIPLEALKAADIPRINELLADPTTSKRLIALQKAPPLRILAPDRPDHIMEQILDRVAFDLKEKLGLQVQVIKRSVSPKSIKEVNPDLIYREWTPDTPWEQADLTILQPLFAPTSPNNYGGYQDDTVRAYFDRLQNTNDPGTTERTYKDVQNRLRQGAPLIWLPIARQMTLFLKTGYRASFVDASTKPSTLIFYTPMLKEIRKRP
jgi:peptide/nickel transport system substrate-binding protein